MIASTTIYPCHILTLKSNRGSHTFLAIPIIMLFTPTIILGLLAVVSACSEHENDHSTGATLVPPLTLPTRPLQWGDVNIIHTTDSHGWLLGHQKTSFPEPNYRCVEVSQGNGWINRRADTIQRWFRWFCVVCSTHEKNCHCTCFFSFKLWISFENFIQERDVDLLLVDSGDLHDGMYCSINALQKKTIPMT